MKSIWMMNQRHYKKLVCSFYCYVIPIEITINTIFLPDFYSMIEDVFYVSCGSYDLVNQEEVL